MRLTFSTPNSHRLNCGQKVHGVCLLEVNSGLPSLLHLRQFTSSKMDTSTLISLLEDLEENIDDLEESLEPLLETAFTVTTKKLPLLDRAKLYTLIVYSIESLLFCTQSYCTNAPIY